MSGVRADAFRSAQRAWADSVRTRYPLMDTEVRTFSDAELRVVSGLDFVTRDGSMYSFDFGVVEEALDREVTGLEQRLLRDAAMREADDLAELVDAIDGIISAS